MTQSDACVPLFQSTTESLVAIYIKLSLQVIKILETHQLAFKWYIFSSTNMSHHKPPVKSIFFFPSYSWISLHLQPTFRIGESGFACLHFLFICNRHSYHMKSNCDSSFSLIFEPCKCPELKKEAKLVDIFLLSLPSMLLTTHVKCFPYS